MALVEIRTVWCPPLNEDQEADNEEVVEENIIDVSKETTADIFIARLNFLKEGNAVSISVSPNKDHDVLAYGSDYNKLNTFGDYHKIDRSANPSIIFKSDPDHQRGFRLRMVPEEMTIGASLVTPPHELEAAVALPIPQG